MATFRSPFLNPLSDTAKSDPPHFGHVGVIVMVVLLYLCAVLANSFV